MKLPIVLVAGTAIVAASFSVAVGQDASAVPYRVSSEIIRNNCAVLQDFLDLLAEGFGDPPLANKQLPRLALERLVSASISDIEQLFKCFRFEEGQLLKHDIDAGISRILIARIDVAKVKLPATPAQDEFVDMTAFAVLIVRQQANGTHTAWGEYRLF